MTQSDHVNGNRYDQIRELWPRVYVASPFTVGDRNENIRRNLLCADRLIAKGYAPYAPLLTAFQDLVAPRSPDDWLSLDLAWLAKAQILLRLPGKSNGADIEEKFAREHGIPVVYSEEALDRLVEERYGTH